MGDQVTPEQRDACQSDVDKAIVLAGVSAVGKVRQVRQHAAWTDRETGERFSATWVAEVRIRRPGGPRVIVMDVADHADDPAWWSEMLYDEIMHAVGRR